MKYKHYKTFSQISMILCKILHVVFCKHTFFQKQICAWYIVRTRKTKIFSVLETYLLQNANFVIRKQFEGHWAIEQTNQREPHKDDFNAFVGGQLRSRGRSSGDEELHAIGIFPVVKKCLWKCNIKCFLNAYKYFVRRQAWRHSNEAKNEAVMPFYIIVFHY